MLKISQNNDNRGRHLEFYSHTGIGNWFQCFPVYPGLNLSSGSGSVSGSGSGFGIPAFPYARRLRWERDTVVSCWVVITYEWAYHQRALLAKVLRTGNINSSYLQINGWKIRGARNQGFKVIHFQFFSLIHLNSS